LIHKYVVTPLVTKIRHTIKPTQLDAVHNDRNTNGHIQCDIQN